MKRTGDAGDRQWFRCLRTSIVRPSGVFIPHKDPVRARGPVCLLDDADPWYYSNAINAYRREMPVEWALSDSDARLRLGSYTEIARWRAVWLDLWGAFAAFAWQVSREELDARGPNKGFVDAPARSIFDRALVNIAPGIMKRYARPHTAAAPSNGRDDLTMPAWVWAWLEIWLCMCQTGIDSVRDQVFRAYERNVYPSRAVIRDGEITFEKNSAQDRLLAEAVARQTQIDLDFIKAQDALHALEFALADGYNKDAFMSLLYLGEHSQAGTVVWLIQGGLLPLFAVQGCPMHAIERGGQVTLEFESETAQIPRITR